MKSASDMRKPYGGPVRSLVIALDVGTTFSGVSYAILEPGLIPKIHGVTRFPGQEHVAGNSKIPSVLWYDRHGKMVAAGAEAETAAIVSQAEDEGWTKAELFKLRLRPRTMKLSMNGMRLSPLPQGMTAVEVFGDFLRYLFHCTRNFIIDTHANGASLWSQVEKNIQFVLSHPNGWEGAQQTKMRRAAVYGRLVPDTNEGKARIWFVTEGEASLHACVLNGLAADVLQNPSNHGFIVADAGGGTLDISSYAIRGTSPLVMEEIAPPDCIFAGSVFVSRRARMFLEEKLKNSKYGTEDALDHIAKKFDETTKRLFRDKRDMQFIPFGSPLDKDPSVGIRGGQLKLTGAEVADLFEPSVQAAVDAIKGQIEASQGMIKSVWLVGGFAASPWLFTQLLERLAPFKIVVSRPDTQTSKAVADGAIGFYCDHHVSARMARFMYGVEFLREFDPNDREHVKRKGRLCELPSGPKLLPDAFDCILARGVKVKESTVFTRKYCTELTSLSLLSVFEVEIWCYRGGNEIPKWILRQHEDYSTLCIVRADLSPLASSATPKHGPSGKTYWKIVFSVEIHFGLTEFKARIKWTGSDGQVKYGPASIIYNERGHRYEEDEPDNIPEDDMSVSSSRHNDRRVSNGAPSTRSTSTATATDTGSAYGSAYSASSHHRTAASTTSHHTSTSRHTSASHLTSSQHSSASHHTSSSRHTSDSRRTSGSHRDGLPAAIPDVVRSREGPPTIERTSTSRSSATSLSYASSRAPSESVSRASTAVPDDARSSRSSRSRAPTEFTETTSTSSRGLGAALNSVWGNAAASPAGTVPPSPAPSAPPVAPEEPPAPEPEPEMQQPEPEPEPPAPEPEPAFSTPSKKSKKGKSKATTAQATPQPAATPRAGTRAASPQPAAEPEPPAPEPPAPEPTAEEPQPQPEEPTEQMPGSLETAAPEPEPEPEPAPEPEPEPERKLSKAEQRKLAKASKAGSQAASKAGSQAASKAASQVPSKVASQVPSKAASAVPSKAASKLPSRAASPPPKTPTPPPEENAAEPEPPAPEPPVAPEPPAENDGFAMLEQPKSRAASRIPSRVASSKATPKPASTPTPASPQPPQPAELPEPEPPAQGGFASSLFGGWANGGIKPSAATSIFGGWGSGFGGGSNGGSAKASPEKEENGFSSWTLPDASQPQAPQADGWGAGSFDNNSLFDAPGGEHHEAIPGALSDMLSDPSQQHHNGGWGSTTELPPVDGGGDDFGGLLGTPKPGGLPELAPMDGEGAGEAPAEAAPVEAPPAEEVAPAADGATAEGEEDTPGGTAAATPTATEPTTPATEKPADDDWGLPVKKGKKGGGKKKGGRK